MAGVEMHANAIQMMLPTPPKFLVPEGALLIFLIILVLALATAIGVARVTVLWGLIGAVAAIVVFTFAMAFLAINNNFVPDLFHPWLAIALTYSGLTAYRVLYEDRERRKVTSLFRQSLNPESVTQLARPRGSLRDLIRCTRRPT